MVDGSKKCGAVNTSVTLLVQYIGNTFWVIGSHSSALRFSFSVIVSRARAAVPKRGSADTSRSVNPSSRLVSCAWVPFGGRRGNSSLPFLWFGRLEAAFKAHRLLIQLTQPESAKIDVIFGFGVRLQPHRPTRQSRRDKHPVMSPGNFPHFVYPAAIHPGVDQVFRSALIASR